MININVSGWEMEGRIQKTVDRRWKTEDIRNKTKDCSLFFGLQSLDFSLINRYFISKVILISILILSKFNISAQCKPQVWSFQAGEELYYDIVYNWGFIWVDAGRVEFKAKKELLGDKEVFHFSGSGKSLPKHDWFFKVRDYFNSWAEISDLRPIKHERNSSEGKYIAEEKYRFDYSKQKIYSDVFNSEKPRKLDSLKLPPCLFDLMTAVYYARTFDLDNYYVNQKIPLSMIVDNEIYNLYGRYLGKEIIKTREKKSINCLKFSIKLIEGTMFKGGEDLQVWISDDINHVPVCIQAEVLVGSVKAYLTDAKNLKYPVIY